MQPKIITFEANNRAEDLFAQVDKKLLHDLLNSYRKIDPEYFQNAHPSTIHIEEQYKGAAILIQYGPGVYLDKIIVHPDAQGNGVGSALMEKALSEKLPLYWRAGRNNPKIGWYEKLVQKSEDAGVEYGTPWNIYWMGEIPYKKAMFQFVCEKPSDFL